MIISLLIRNQLKKIKSNKEVQRIVRKAAREGKIVFASDERMQYFYRCGLVDTFNKKVIRTRAALISDYSTLDDFAEYGPHRERDKARLCTRVFEFYGVSCKPHDRIVDVLEQIEKKQNHS